MNGLDGVLGRPLAVRILDAEKIFAAVTAREQPVEQRRARPANMQETGRGGGKTRDDVHGLLRPR